MNHKFRLNERDEMHHINRYLLGMLMDAGHHVQFIEHPSLSDRILAVNSGYNGVPYDLAIEAHFNADADHLDPLDMDDSRGSGCMVLHAPRAKTAYTQEPPSERRDQAEAMSCILSAAVGNRNLGPRGGWYWGGNNPGTKKDAFLSHTICPAFIPEPGYIDNNAFADQWLASGHYRQLAEALCECINSFFMKKAKV